MQPTIRELGLWDGSVALIIDGGAGDPERPAVHLQAGAGGCLRLVGPDGAVMWGLVDSGWYSVQLVRAPNAAMHVLPPIRVDETERAPGIAGAPEFIGWWTRHYASQLCASRNTPIARGRQSLLASMSSVDSAPPGSISDWHRRKWQPLVLRTNDLDDLRAQREDFELDWDARYLGLLTTRALSDESDGRVKSWRKRARDRRLPPLVVWWCRGLYSHVLLDGHDRLHAALLEDVSPDIVVLADVSAHAIDDVEQRKQQALDQAAILQTVPVTNRSAATNSVLRAAWDPRTEWDLATPGFPLEGGIARWEEDVRGTSLVNALASRGLDQR